MTLAEFCVVPGTFLGNGSVQAFDVAAILQRCLMVGPMVAPRQVPMILVVSETLSNGRSTELINRTFRPRRPLSAAKTETC